MHFAFELSALRQPETGQGADFCTCLQKIHFCDSLTHKIICLQFILFSEVYLFFVHIKVKLIKGLHMKQCCLLHGIVSEQKVE